MTTILLIIQIFIVLCLVGVVLLQKTGGDSLAGLSGGGHNFLSSKSASNVFSKATIILAIAFMTNSLIIAKNITHKTKPKSSIIESLEKNNNLDTRSTTPNAPSTIE